MSIALLSLFRLFTSTTVDTNITRVKDPEFLRREPTNASEFIAQTRDPISPSVCPTHTLISLFTVHPRTGPQTGRPVHSDTVYTAALTRTHDTLALHHGTGPALSSHL